MKLNNLSIVVLICIASSFLAGCVTTQTRYGWNDYQPKVHSYFQGDSTDEQITTLEKNLEELKAHDQLAPPGFHAHLGMLYAQVGSLDQATQEFNTEKRLFPESAPYMDFLLKSDQKKNALQVGKNATTTLSPAGGKKERSDSLRDFNVKKGQ